MGQSPAGPENPECQPAALKARLRDEVRSRALQHPMAERVRESEQLVQHLRGQSLWQSASAVLGFIPLRDEPDVMPLLRDVLQNGKRLAVLRWIADQDRYEPAWVRDLETDLVVGMHGVRQPREGIPDADINLLDFGLIPGVAFDLAFGRIGRGRGFYDRVLQRFRGVKCGVAFDWQLVVDVPMESHDILLDCLMTPSGWRQRVDLSGSQE